MADYGAFGVVMDNPTRLTARNQFNPVLHVPEDLGELGRDYATSEPPGTGVNIPTTGQMWPRGAGKA